jgi:hypothetical protein
VVINTNSWFGWTKSSEEARESNWYSRFGTLCGVLQYLRVWRGRPRPWGSVGRARLQSCRKAENDSGTVKPPDRTKSTPPAHFFLSNRSAARLIVSQVMQSFSILTLPQAKLRRYRSACSGVIRIVLAISINSSSSSDTGVPR